MVETKVSPEIWNQEVEKFKNACHELGRTIKGTKLKNHFLGLKCRSWYSDNAPDYVNIKTYTDFIEYLGKDITSAIKTRILIAIFFYVLKFFVFKQASYFFPFIFIKASIFLCICSFVCGIIPLWIFCFKLWFKYSSGLISGE